MWHIIKADIRQTSYIPFVFGIGALFITWYLFYIGAESENFYLKMLEWIIGIVILTLPTRWVYYTDKLKKDQLYSRLPIAPVYLATVRLFYINCIWFLLSIWFLINLYVFRFNNFGEKFFSHLLMINGVIMAFGALIFISRDIRFIFSEHFKIFDYPIGRLINLSMNTILGVLAILIYIAINFKGKGIPIFGNIFFDAFHNLYKPLFPNPTIALILTFIGLFFSIISVYAFSKRRSYLI